MPDVSVIIPTFNSAATIAATLESVRGQTFGAWEAIVVDDCSTDSTCDIVQEIARNDDRIRLVELSENSGRPAVPRNVGVRAATGYYVAFLDSDDLWHPQKLDIQLAAMNESGIPFCATRIVQFTIDQELFAAKSADFSEANIARSRITHDRLLRKNTLCNSSVMATRELALETPFIEDVRYKAIEDYHCWLTMLQRRALSGLVLEAPLTFYRITASSISRSKWFMFQRNRILYAEYETGGKKLGVKRFFYWGTYTYYSVMRRLFDKNYQP